MSHENARISKLEARVVALEEDKSSFNINSTPSKIRTTTTSNATCAFTIWFIR